MTTTPTTFDPETTSDSQLVAASFAAHGWPVIPLHAHSRTPHGSGGHRHRGIWVLDPSEIPVASDDYSEQTGGGTLSWGLMCGEPNPDGWRVVVLDTDDDEAERRLGVALERYGARAWADSTLTVRTHRGRHLYGLTRREVPTGKPWSGFDLKGAGGYVVVSGCRHPDGGTYADVTGTAGSVLNGNSPPDHGIFNGIVEHAGELKSLWSLVREIPDALLTALVRPLEDQPDRGYTTEQAKSLLSASPSDEQRSTHTIPHEGPERPSTGRTAPGTGTSEDVHLLERRIHALIDSVETAGRGEGNSMLNWAAGRAAALCGANPELDSDEIRARLVMAFTNREIPQGETDRSREREAQATVASGWRYGTDHPEIALRQSHAERAADRGRIVAKIVAKHPHHQGPPKGGSCGDSGNDPLPRSDSDPLLNRVHSWEALDLEPYLDGTIELPRPTVLRRSDGVGLFYEGMVNLLYGASESGKSWIALATALEAMQEDDRNVLYVDLEDMPQSTVRRLLSIGARPEVLRDRFGYVHPEGGVSPLQVNRWGEPTATVSGTGNWQAFEEEIARRDPSLIVVDGMTVLYGFHGLDTNSASNTDVITAWLKSLTGYGKRTILLIDHTNKNAQPGDGPTGSQHKTSMVQGTSIQVSPISRPRIGHKGEVRLTIGKDRHGSLRGSCPDLDPQTAADVRIESSSEGDHVVIAVQAPKKSVNVLAPSDDMSRSLSNLDKDTAAILKVLVPGRTMKSGEIRMAIPGNLPDKRFRSAMKALEMGGRITVTGSGPSTRYSSNNV